MKIEEARAIWEEIVRENYKAKMDYELRWLARLLRVKIGKHGEFKATYLRAGKLRNDRNYAWAYKHFNSLLKKYEERMEHERKKESPNNNSAG